jgi:hypothetical protein
MPSGAEYQARIAGMGQCPRGESTMKAYVVTQKGLPEELVPRLLSQDSQDDVAIISAGDESDATSLARSLLVRRKVPVAMLLDAESISPHLVRQRTLELRALLTSVSASPAEVFLAVPELEAIFFQVPRLLERVLGLAIPETLEILAEARPKAALDRLFAQHQSIKTMSQLLSALTPGDSDELRKTKPIAELNEFLRHALHEVSAA